MCSAPYTQEREERGSGQVMPFMCCDKFKTVLWTCACLPDEALVQFSALSAPIALLTLRVRLVPLRCCTSQRAETKDIYVCIVQYSTVMDGGVESRGSGSGSGRGRRETRDGRRETGRGSLWLVPARRSVFGVVLQRLIFSVWSLMLSLLHLPSLVSGP